MLPEQPRSQGLSSYRLENERPWERGCCQNSNKMKSSTRSLDVLLNSQKFDKAIVKEN